MKHVYLLFTAFAFFSCSKEELYSPWNLKDGQEVEVLVSHRYGAMGDELVLLPRNQTGSMDLYYFTKREPGYNYRVRAKMVAPETPPQDGPAYHLEFIEVVSKEKYEGNESFEIGLIQAPIFGEPIIRLWKHNDEYYFVAEKIALTYTDEQVGDQLEEIWKHNEELIENYKNKIIPEIKWRAIKAMVTHDPENFGKAYLVSDIEFTER